jgi:hypothetical protein
MSSSGTKLALINPHASRLDREAGQCADRRLPHSAIHMASFMSVLRPGTFLMCAALATISSKSPPAFAGAGSAQDLPDRCPIDPGRFHRDMRAPALRQPRQQRQQPVCRGREGPALPRHLTAGHQPHTGDDGLFVDVKAGNPFVHDLHFISSTPVPPAWGPRTKRNLTNVLRGVAALGLQWGSSRLLGSNSQSGSPAPWSADLWPTVPTLYPQRPTGFIQGGRPPPAGGDSQ